MQAIAGAMGEPSLDDLAAFDFSDEAFDDPLGIAQSWEEKHGKKKPKDPFAWRSMFDGKTLKGWKVPQFGGEGEVTHG